MALTEFLPAIENTQIVCVYVPISKCQYLPILDFPLPVVTWSKFPCSVAILPHTVQLVKCQFVKCLSDLLCTLSWR